MNKKTLTLNKKECNAVIEHALNTVDYPGYFMCNQLEFGIGDVTKSNWPQPKLDAIIKNSFPEFTRENFLKFLKKNYPDELFEVRRLAKRETSIWLRGYSDNETAIRKAFLRTLIKE